MGEVVRGVSGTQSLEELERVGAGREGPGADEGWAKYYRLNTGKVYFILLTWNN